MDGYEHIPDVGPAWAPTKKDERRQRERVEMRRHAVEVAATAPPLSPATLVRVSTLLSRPTPKHDLMRWRLRLYCGHVVERTAHHTHTTVHAAFMGAVRCDDCGLDPATIVSAAALGRFEPPASTATTTRRPEAERIEGEIARHQAEIDRLRRQLAKDDPLPR